MSVNGGWLIENVVVSNVEAGSLCHRAYLGVVVQATTMQRVTRTLRSGEQDNEQVSQGQRLVEGLCNNTA